MTPIKNSTLKKFSSLLVVLQLTHCASAPKPPHCHDDGRGLKPVNHSSVKLKPIEQKP